MLLHLLPSQSQNINSPLHLCSIYIKRKGTADPPWTCCEKKSIEKREREICERGGIKKTRTIREKLQVQKPCCWQQRHPCIVWLKRVEVWTLWERQHIKVSLERRQSETDTAWSRRWTEERGDWGGKGARKSELTSETRRGYENTAGAKCGCLSWIIHSVLMNDRWAEHYYPSKNSDGEGRKTAQVTLPLKMPRPTADPNITEVSPPTSAPASVSWPPLEGEWCQ